MTLKRYDDPVATLPQDRDLEMKSLCASVTLEVQERIMATLRIPSNCVATRIAWAIYQSGGDWRILESRFKTCSAHGRS